MQQWPLKLGLGQHSFKQDTLGRVARQGSLLQLLEQLTKAMCMDWQNKHSVFGKRLVKICSAAPHHTRPSSSFFVRKAAESVEPAQTLNSSSTSNNAISAPSSCAIRGEDAPLALEFSPDFNPGFPASCGLTDWTGHTTSLASKPADLRNSGESPAILSNLAVTVLQPWGGGLQSVCSACAGQYSF